MIRTVVSWAACAALLGAIAGFFLGTDDSDVSRQAMAFQGAMISVPVWMSIGALSGAVVFLTANAGLTFGRLALGLLVVVLAALGAGLLWTIAGYGIQALLLERVEVRGTSERDGPLLCLICETFMYAGGSAVCAAAVGYLTWAGVALARRTRS